MNRLKQDDNKTSWPSRSTIDELLKKHHLIRKRKRTPKLVPYSEPFILCENPNDVWSIDYKGQFLLGNKELCYPLNIFVTYVPVIQGEEVYNFL